MPGFRNEKTLEQQKTERKILILRIVFLAMILAGFLLFVWAWEKRSNESKLNPEAGMELKAPAKQAAAVTYKGETYIPRDDLETTLLMGTDVSEDEPRSAREGGYSMADVLVLIVANKTDKTYTVIQINRDTITPITMMSDDGKVEGYFNGQITLAYAYGGSPVRCAKNTIEAVRRTLLNIPIDHYVAVTMDSVGVLNDMVGGVTVEVMDDGIDPDLVKGQKAKLNGEQALRYVRARRSLDNPTNEHRMERQKQFLTGLMDSFRKKSARDSSFVMDVLVKLSEYMDSDCSIQQLSDLLNTFVAYEQAEFTGLKGESVSGETLKDFGDHTVFTEFYPDREGIWDLVMRVFYKKNK